MLRKIIIGGAAAVAGYVIGVRAGFDVAVRDYTENGARKIKSTAERKEKFDYGEDVSSSDEEDDDETDVSVTFA